MANSSRFRWLVALIGALALVLGACGDSDDGGVVGDGDIEQPDGDTDDGGEAASLEVTAIDNGEGGGYGFEVASSVPAGPTQLNLTSTGAEAHHAQLFKLNEGATMEQLGEQLATGDPAAALQVGAFQGGSGVIDPGSESQADAVVDFTEGTWVLMCFVENAQGPHLAQGMIQPFAVTAETDAAEPPTADADVGLVDFGFQLPDSITGDAVLELSNQSEAQPHEMNIARLAEGATQDDLVAFFTGEGEAAAEGPPPFSGLGGMQALLPGSSQLLQLELDPGEYVLYCAIPDFTSPEMTPHLALGMIATVNIS